MINLHKKKCDLQWHKKSIFPINAVSKLQINKYDVLILVIFSLHSLMRSSIVTAMLNLLSYVGMGLQSELCFWTLLGLLRTIFDATLFKVNANLKQVRHIKFDVLRKTLLWLLWLRHTLFVSTKQYTMTFYFHPKAMNPKV